MANDKYVVFKKATEGQDGWSPLYHAREALPDAVVIRTQDVFAEHGLRAYAGAVVTAMDILTTEANNAHEWCSKEHAAEVREKVSELQRLADYFNDMADAAHAVTGKVPD